MKIEFHYSNIYDDMLTEMSKKTQDLMQIREVQRFMKTFEFGWTQREKKIILAIEKFSG